MRVLRCAEAIDEEINTQPDRHVAHLLARHMSFMGEHEGDETLTVILVEPGDTADGRRHRATRPATRQRLLQQAAGSRASRLPSKLYRISILL